jgi:ubiquinone/menaquinone biosynthesis C-methylase UbiE
MEGSMADSSHYVIRGGTEGRERLRILGRVMHASTSAFFDRIGLRDGLSCLDMGCGGGDVTVEIARRVAPRGRVVGADLDAIKLEMARREAAEAGLLNVRFDVLDIRNASLVEAFDVVYARFLLTHLPDPAGAVAAFFQCVRPGGIVAVEDIDFRGYFTHPESPAFRRYHELYCATVRRRGGDPDIGPRVPGLLTQAGFREIDVAVVQPVGLEGEVKLINPLTMENIRGAVLEDGLATAEEIEVVVRELFEFAADPASIAGTPRVLQTWGRRPFAASA